MKAKQRIGAGLALAVLFSCLASAKQAQPEARDALRLASEQGPRMALAGTSSCSARACHGGLVPQDQAPQQNEHTTWITKDKHANAYLVLFNDRSEQIARNLKDPAGQVVPAHENDRCLACHTNNLSTFDSRRLPALRGRDPRRGGL